MKTRTILIAISFATASLATGTAAADEMTVVATLAGEEMTPAEAWAKADACLVETLEHLACFKTETELLSHIGHEPTVNTESVAPRQQSRSSSCSTSLRLYDGSLHTGQVLYLSQRGIWINLSSYGFSNRTSSYKIGACSSYFADYSNGGGSWYPTSQTQAYDQASWMQTGWDNRVSSVKIL